MGGCAGYFLSVPFLSSGNSAYCIGWRGAGAAEGNSGIYLNLQGSMECLQKVDAFTVSSCAAYLQFQMHLSSSFLLNLRKTVLSYSHVSLCIVRTERMVCQLLHCAQDVSPFCHMHSATPNQPGRTLRKQQVHFSRQQPIHRSRLCRGGCRCFFFSPRWVHGCLPLQSLWLYWIAK